MNHDHIIQQCQTWVSEFIAWRGICPFAKPVLEDNQVGWLVINEPELEEQLLAVMGQIQSLLASDEPETMLLILPNYQANWFDFLTLIECANQLLKEQGLLIDVQIASFHPEYQFEGEDPDSASHFTNRSPWPIIHLIRQTSISRALETYPDPEGIPQRNIHLMQRLGVDYLSQQLADFQRQSKD